MVKRAKSRKARVVPSKKKVRSKTHEQIPILSEEEVSKYLYDEAVGPDPNVSWLQILLGRVPTQRPAGNR